MSRDEKLAQLGSTCIYELLDGPRLDLESSAAILKHGIGQVSRVGGVETLRSEWGFAGTLVSDYNGIEELAVTHRLAADLEEAAVIAIEAGVDVELPSTVAYGGPLQQAIESGRVDASDVDRSVARVLRQKYELGLFGNALVAAGGNHPTESDRALAHRAGVRAVLHAWLPGERGAAAVAGALFGDFSPGGKLPITVPRHVGQVPIYHGHKPTGGGVRLKGDYVDRPSTPRYPFGFGLSDTTFEVTGPELGATKVPTDGSVSATVHVVNTGNVAGDEVVQVYARRLAASVTRPVRELVGFARIALDPGEARTVTFNITADLLGFIDRETHFAVEPGPVAISAGTSAADFVGTVPIELVGPTIVAPERSFFSSVEVG